jgi:hypothetical protein
MVGEFFSSFQDVDQYPFCFSGILNCTRRGTYVDNVLALAPLLSIGAAAGRKFGKSDLVHIVDYRRLWNLSSLY